MGDPKGLEALKKKILLDHGIDERFSVTSEECANLISEDMAEFQKPKNAQMLPYDEAKWEVPFESMQFQGRRLLQGLKKTRQIFELVSLKVFKFEPG